VLADQTVAVTMVAASVPATMTARRAGVATAGAHPTCLLA
jgi:hypothetical protein